MPLETFDTKAANCSVKMMNPSVVLIQYVIKILFFPKSIGGFG